MVKDLLDASRVQTQELKLRRAIVDIGALLAEAVESFESTNVEVVYVGPQHLDVDGDPARLLQVAFNLVGNALKFTPPGGRIEVTARREGDTVLVEVKDNGTGIDKADIAKLFRPFSQVHDTTQSSRSGAGLGLFISKGIVESHGGRIWATSPGRGKGTTFHVSLPPGGRPVVQATTEA